MIQVEFDASVKDNNSFMGFIILDSNGDITESRVVYLEGESSSVRAEMFSALSSLKHCASIGLKSVVLYGDCSEAIRYLTEIKLNKFNNKKVLSKFERRYIYRLIRLFESVSFYYVPRESNWRAHCLVDNGEYNEGQSWRCLFPDFPRRSESRQEV